ncbi:CPBP family intramembrane metalloprotease [Candidatus Fermentibacteria bacterium]|nr:CPBP family intramembrane metalloprotease [Candidatus Fermentibacteria bacterium]
MTPFRRIALLWLLEMRSLVRDRRALVISVVLPAVIMPVMLSAGRWMESVRRRQAEKDTCRYAVTGPGAAEAESLLALALSGEDGVEAVRSSADPDSLYAEGSLDALVRAFRRPSRGDGEILLLRIDYREDISKSETLASILSARLDSLRLSCRIALLSEHGLPYGRGSDLVDRIDAAPRWRTSGAKLGTFATAFVLLFLLSGAAVASTDSIAGEREKGTLETLLSTSAARSEIVGAKLLAVVSVGVATVLIQAFNFVLYMGLEILPFESEVALRVTPGTAAALLVLLLPVAALASGAMLYVSAASRTAREAQFMSGPVMILGLVPALAPLLPGLEAGSPVLLVPVAGASVCLREALAGRTDWLFTGVAALSTAAAAALLAWRAAAALSSEDLLFSTESPAPGPRSFARSSARAFTVLWVVSVIFSMQAGGSMDTRLLLTINLVAVILGGSLLLAARNRIRPGRDMGFRWPGPVPVLLGIPGALAGMVLALGAFRLVSLVYPVASAELEAFARALMPGEMSRAQAALFLCVLPALCEETAFRGLLLGTLSRTGSRAGALLVSTFFFSLFHFSWFRLVPTAVLGILLGLAALLSGSIYPAMLWHALNNAVVLLPGRLPGWLETMHPAWYAVPLLVLAAVFLGMYRSSSKRPSG